jgi:Na+/H+ antiporter NhaC
MIVMPAAVVVLLIYILQGLSVEAPSEIDAVEWLKVVPYVVVLVTAVIGVNVTIVLTLGIAICILVGLISGTYSLFDSFAAMGNGITGMGELIIITLMAGGMLEIIRFNRGIDFIIGKITKYINGKRGAEFSIAALVSVANLCTANNTIAIITTGPIARDITQRFGLDPRKSAGLLDTFSCFVQGIIPYGAQLLMAAGLAGISPISIVGYLYYPFVMGFLALLAIVFRFPKRYS